MRININPKQQPEQAKDCGSILGHSSPPSVGRNTFGPHWTCNTALELLSATQEVKSSAFSQGLLDGDFFKYLAKKHVSRFDDLFSRAAKYINMEDAQASKKDEGKRKDFKEKEYSKKS
ncbi:UNVERIFIED_CONTAM: hypothetical protein Slati_4437300 [Sesamum latifolium]|uniref:Uncharacterized protein n=1 Tax=Sesamum latifolium TaxID=2727402 RepID=A0AAW2SSS7_9LAMI